VMLNPGEFISYVRTPTTIRAIELDFEGELRDSRGMRRFTYGDYYCENEVGCSYLTSAHYMRQGYKKPGDGPLRPRVVCLCGSTKFMDAFRLAALHETLGGRIVLSIGCDLRGQEFDTFTREHKAELKVGFDELHKRKIDLADEILVINIGGYIGDSTKSEIRYAIAHGKSVRWLEPDKKWDDDDTKTWPPEKMT